MQEAGLPEIAHAGRDQRVNNTGLSAPEQISTRNTVIIKRKYRKAASPYQNNTDICMPVPNVRALHFKQLKPLIMSTQSNILSPGPDPKPTTEPNPTTPEIEPTVPPDTPIPNII